MWIASDHRGYSQVKKLIFNRIIYIYFLNLKLKEIEFRTYLGLLNLKGYFSSDPSHASLLGSKIWGGADISKFQFYAKIFYNFQSSF